MLSYRKLAMRVLGRPLNTGGGINSPRPASQRAAALVRRNAHHPYRPGLCRDMVHRRW